ncbi:MAG: 4-hydroxyproline epimerase [Xanthomonadales bacterium]|nr:4-hydroxyproline epimerase [Xanthomonadales bacterium]NIN58481.1 4-hydroxyproline epimerase [Xanthomonadales bacterium]NIN76033.1 4-hydroxyproline epimerase [Xanthomonadales bacterium]NIO13669.1 4-hydroxyproline epimerase [Xanthomonadales bacterium]NIP10874.1 4-hydroxyproline epimerase [Xanthomonadales bacterium]
MSRPPARTFQCVDAHTCGNPVRVVVQGGPPLEGRTMLDRRERFMAEYDWIRTALMFEPRGHAMMSGSILYPSTREDCDIGVLFIETSGCLPMCGHGTIGTVTVALEQGLVTPRESGRLDLDTPAGRVEVTYRQQGARVRSVRFTNVPSFLHSRGLVVECPELGGELTLDVAYGGNFYAIVEPQAHYRDLSELDAGDILRISPRLRERLNRDHEFVHPEDERIAGLSHLLWAGAPLKPESSARNAVFYGDKAIDRSPCGTGTSARMAQLAARGELEVGEPFVHESYIGSQFTGRIEALTQVGDQPAIVPSIEGWARIYGHNRITVDPEDDPYWQGFLVR